VLIAWLRRYGDLIVAVALAIAFEIELLTTFQADVDKMPALVVLGLLATLPLAYRRTLPLASFVVVWCGMISLAILVNRLPDESFAFTLVFFFSLYSVGAHSTGREAWATGALVTFGVGLFVASDDDPFELADILFAAAFVGGPWAAGLAIRLRRRREQHLRARAVQLELDRHELARRAVADERARIARELHDVVSHAISVTILQARGGRHMLGVDDAAAREAFEAIDRTNQQALGDMRRLLSLLRESDEELGLAPQPSLRGLEALAAEARTSGQQVEVAISGDPRDLPPGVDLSAYRIVQEALTNVRKHAGHARAWVTVHYGTDDVDVAVRNDGPVDHSAVNGELGHGLVGIRERVAVVGGDVSIGPCPEGGFLVHARLPYAVNA
jgi:signal transduction histidine kinase